MKGLTTSEALAIGKGKNILTPPASTTWYEMLFDKFKDPIILILIVADIFSFVVNFIQKEPLWEPLAILAAILITTLVGWWQDMSSKAQFDSLNKVSDDELIKVYRDGSVTEIPKCDIVVGDVILLNAGDECPADVQLLSAIDLHIDEAAMTGESVPVVKSVDVIGNPTIPSNVVLRGTNVTEGSAEGVVTHIGDDTKIGQTTRQAREMTDDKTPLTIQLEKLAGNISVLSFYIGGLLLAFLNAHYFFFTEYDASWTSIVATELKFIMTAVVIIIAAVPEGLALSVVLALAYSVKAMMKDNNLVKKMKATETVGAVNIVFTDKTGTLTANRMTVVDSHITNRDQLVLNAAVNSTANIDASGKIIGNPTEGAILNWLDKDLNIDYKYTRNNIHVVSQKPFNSTDKYMSTELYNGQVLYKGAPEVIANLCGDKSYLDRVTEEQNKGRRAISFASNNKEGDLRYDGTVFIEDPVRNDVPDAVSNCYKAGVDVIMMTGDNILTASEIARQANFKSLTPGLESIRAIEAKDFDEKQLENGVYPNVIARCKPEDKLRILKAFQERGYICAMTGDGVNDSPSLNHANVGIAMGAGTSVAKEASDIVLLDNAFPSIVKGIKWGRSLYKNIQSFLSFQLTVNVALCLTAMFAPLIGCESPFGIIEILYINLVMDALGALALASEPAMDRVLNDKPRDNNKSIIDSNMIKFIGSSGLVLFATMVAMILFPLNLGATGLFATFMTFNWMNLFRARSFGKNMGTFESLSRNKLFLFVAGAILVMNVLIVQFGGTIFGTEALNILQWLEVAGISIAMVAVSGIVNKMLNK